MTLINIFKKLFTINDSLILFYIFFQLALVVVFGGAYRGYFILFYLLSTVIFVGFLLIPRTGELTFFHFMRSIYPLMLIYFFYRILSIQSRILDFKYYDSILYNLEKKVLGIYSSFALQGVMEVWLNELSYLFYALGLILPFWALVKLYQVKNIDYFYNFILALEIGCLTCLLTASVFPVMGPSIALNDYFYLSILGPVLSVMVPEFLVVFAPEANTFPAVYFCLVVISAYYLWDFGKTYILLSFILISGVFWGGVYLRYHYLVDGISALIVAFVAASIAGIVYHMKHGPPGNSDT